MSSSESEPGQLSDEAGPSEKSNRRQKRTAASKPVVYSGSSESEEEMPVPKVSKPRAKKPRKRSESPFPAGLFEGVEKERVSGMNELEREMVVYKKMEENELKKQREELRQKMLEKKQNAEKKKGGKKGVKKDSDDDSAKEDKEFASSSESEGEIREPKVSASKASGAEAEDEEADMDYHRPSEVNEKRSKKKAMDALLSKRRDKKEAEEKRKEQSSSNDNRAVVDFDAIFGGSRRRSASSGSSSGSSSVSSAGSRSVTPEPPTKREIENREDLEKIKLTRGILAKYVHLPYFNKLAIGSFVRIGIGNRDGRAVYRVAEIVDVVETAKVYNIEHTRTNKGVKLKVGKETRVYRLEYLSNSKFTETEYHQWLKTMRDADCKLPTVEEVERKEKEIGKLINHQFTNEEIDFMIKEKQRFQKNPTNFAVEKSRLMKEKADAEEQGNLARVREIQNEIDDLDSRADEAERTRNGKLSAVTWINRKRRVEMTQNFLDASKVNWDAVRQDDPFTRKSNRTKVVSGSSKKKQEANGSPPVADPTQQSTLPLDTPGTSNTPEAVVVPSKTVKVVETTSVTVVKSTSSGGRPDFLAQWRLNSSTPSTNFDYHKDIEIDIDDIEI